MDKVLQLIEAILDKDWGSQKLMLLGGLAFIFVILSVGIYGVAEMLSPSYDNKINKRDSHS